jgi:hypothetical protein
VGKDQESVKSFTKKIFRDDLNISQPLEMMAGGEKAMMGGCNPRDFKEVHPSDLLRIRRQNQWAKVADIERSKMKGVLEQEAVKK